MAQDPDREEEVGLTTHALDMVTLWSSSAVTAEMEADMIKGVLESNQIPVMVRVESVKSHRIRRARVPTSG